MNIVQQSFLAIIKAGLTASCLEVKGLSPLQWKELFVLSDGQGLLPFVFDTCCRFGNAGKPSFDREKNTQAQALHIAVRQIFQTKEFLTIIKHAQKQGLDPIVLKGIICRELYPQPILRPSVDEDILVSSEDAAVFHQFLISEGLFSDDPTANPEAVSELSYHKENSPTYIELHKKLFDPDSDVFGDFNTLFEGVFDRTVRVQVEDVSIRTLAPTDHLLYLILHAFKHFVHSGIGIRAVCDIALFSEQYAEEINWEYLRNSLEQVHAFDFTRAIYQIAKKNLLPDAAFFARIRDWQFDKIDADPLLDDILKSGVHGNSSIERLHSSNITLNAVAKGQSFKQNGSLGAVFHTVFLPLGKMSGRYPYLKKAPLLLPFAWVQRIFRYLKENVVSGKGRVPAEHQRTMKSGASESIRLGQSRVELLRKYGII